MKMKLAPILLISMLFLIVMCRTAYCDDTWVGTDTTGNAYRTGNVGIGTTSPSHKLEVKDGELAVSINNDVRNVYGLNISQLNDLNKYYRPLGFIHYNNGSLRISGQLCGHSDVIGKANVDITISKRGSFLVNGYVFGKIGRSDIEIFEDSYGSLCVYLITNQWSEVNIDISAAGTDGHAYVSIGDPMTIVPEGSLIFTLSSDAGNVLRSSNSGHIGIGTSSPQGVLDVGDYAGAAIKIRDSRANPDIVPDDIAGGRIDFIAGEDWKHVMTSIRSVSSGTWYRTSHDYGASGYADIVFYTTPFQNLSDVLDEDDPNTLEERVRITHDGKVGIGTTTPDNKLDVKGTIRAEEIKVESGWSDFVFDQDYHLPSLDLVESFIKENKHLPDIPSAKEVQADGLSVADMTAKQMQKIEELTLYLIDLKKENVKLQERISALECRSGR